MLAKDQERRIWWTGVILAGAIVLFHAASDSVMGQRADPFGISGLEIQLARTHRLSRSELKHLRPFIDREKENVLQLYFQCVDSGENDFSGLWADVLFNRRDFERGLSRDLTSREKTALRAARSELESKILTVWLDDYIMLLSDALELDGIQFNIVQLVFQNEHDKRSKLVDDDFRRPVRLELEWKNLTDERDRTLKETLRSDQFRIYLSLIGGGDVLFAQISTNSRNELLARG